MKKNLFDLGDEFVKNPSFDNLTNLMGRINENIYGFNPYKKQLKVQNTEPESDRTERDYDRDYENVEE